MQVRLNLINKELLNIRNEQINKTFHQANVSNGSLKDDVSMSNSIYKRLLNLKQIYGQLYEICVLVNSTFGWSSLTIFTQSFCGLVHNGYWLFTILYDNLHEFGILYVCLTFLIQNIAPISILAFYCSTCYQTVRQSFK